MLWSSKNKHGGYVSRGSSCTTFGTCADTCEDNATPRMPPIVNVGEPGFPLVTNLTTQGFITTANGWTSAGSTDGSRHNQPGHAMAGRVRILASLGASMLRSARE